MLATTSKRVETHTKPEVNERIHRQADRLTTYFRHHPQEIRDRLEELDREWDIERTLETQFGSLVALGALMSLLTRNKWWLILTGLPGAFMIQHAIQGWCPPVPLWRRAGIRTAREIEEERCALKRLLKER